MKNSDVWIDDEIICSVCPDHTLLVFEEKIYSDIFKAWWMTQGKEEFVKYCNNYMKKDLG